MLRVGKTKSNAEPITVIPETQLFQQDCPPTAGELTTANADVEFPLKQLMLPWQVFTLQATSKQYRQAFTVWTST